MNKYTLSGTASYMDASRINFVCFVSLHTLECDWYKSDRSRIPFYDRPFAHLIFALTTNDSQKI
jgi:hypothetical protein